MISDLGPTASAIVVILGVLATWGLLAQWIAASRAVRIARATGRDPAACTCDGYSLSIGGPHDPACPKHGHKAPKTAGDRT